jgi:hypothetical protein
MFEIAPRNHSNRPDGFARCPKAAAGTAAYLATAPVQVVFHHAHQAFHENGHIVGGGTVGDQVQ